jgi:hypothetical protein
MQCLARLGWSAPQMWPSWRLSLVTSYTTLYIWYRYNRLQNRVLVGLGCYSTIWNLQLTMRLRRAGFRKNRWDARWKTHHSPRNQIAKSPIFDLVKTEKYWLRHTANAQGNVRSLPSNQKYNVRVADWCCTIYSLLVHKAGLRGGASA